MDQNILDFVCLFDLDADTHAVDAGLDKNFLVLIAGNRQGVEEELRGGLGFYLGDIVSL